MTMLIEMVKKLFTQQQKITFSGAAGAQIKSCDLVQTKEAQRQLQLFEKYFKLEEVK